MPFDLSWKNLIYGPGHHVIAFVLNSSINSLCTPDMLKLWGYKSSDACCLCGGSPANLHHILSNCSIALHQKRYTWRHDSVLLHLKLVLSSHIEKRNRTYKMRSKAPPHILKSFVMEGETSSSRVVSNESSLLDGANDWRIQFDFDHAKVLFPLEIYSTSQRPDIVIWSPSLNKVYLVELTCPAEEGIEAAQARKQGRYAKLASVINDTTSWSAKVFTIESGARGFVARSMHGFLRKVGLSGLSARKICKNISLITAKCSYEIFLLRSRSSWLRRRALLDLDLPSEEVVEEPLMQEDNESPDEVVDRQKSVVKKLKDHGVRMLFHFTDRSNVNSIMRYGLLSWQAIEERKLETKLGGNEVSRQLDTKNRLQDYVSLSFTRSPHDVCLQKRP